MLSSLRCVCTFTSGGVNLTAYGYICRYSLASALQLTSRNPIRFAWKLFSLDDLEHFSIKQTTKPYDRHMLVSHQLNGRHMSGYPSASPNVHLYEGEGIGEYKIDSDVPAKVCH
jgi:hypothetical protein